MQKLRLFAVTAGVLLFLELFAPYAYAQPVSAQQAASQKVSLAGASCSAREMSAAEVQALWTNTLGFSPNEINFMQLQDAIKNMQDAGKYAFPPAAQGTALGTQEVNLGLIAGILGVSDQQAAKDLGLKAYCENNFKGQELKDCLAKYFDDKENVKSTASIPLSTAEKYAAQRGKPTNFIVQQLQKSGLLPGGGTAAGVTAEQTPQKCEDLKIAIAGGTPGQNEVSLCKLLEAQKMKPEQCALDNENIQGRVTYAALLDKDLVYCSDRTKQCAESNYVSPASGVQVDDTPVEQHLASKEVIGFLSLGKDGSNLLIPSFFEEWTAFSGWWNHLDFMASTLLGIGMLTYNVKNTKDLAKAKSDLELLRGGASTSSVSQLVGHESLFKETTAVFDSAITTFRTTDPARSEVIDAVMKRLNILGEAEGAVDKDAVDAARKIVNKIKTAGTGANIVLEHDELANLFKNLPATPGVTPPNINLIAGQPLGQSIDAAGNVVQDFDLRNAVRSYVSTGDTYWELTLKPEKARVEALKSLQAAEEKIDLSAKFADLLSRRAYTSMMLGGAFLGPARLLFSINDRIFFTMTSSNKEQYMRVYVNHPEIASDFRKATDLWGTGKLEEVIAKYAGVPIPAKAFQAGKVFLINTPEKDGMGSVTRIFQKPETSIQSTWVGNSFATNFEDVGSFGEGDTITSLQFKLYQTSPNVVVNRQREATIANYVLGVLPLYVIARNVAKHPGGGVLGVASFLLLNEYIMEFDPLLYKDVECDKKLLDSFKIKFKAYLIAGWAATVIPSLPLFKATLLSSSTTFSAIVGSKLFKGVSFLTNTANNLNLPLAFQWRVASQAENYVSSCADPEYKILTYQKLPEAVKTKASGIAEKLQPVTDVLSQLGIGTAAQQAFGKTENPLDKMTEILNFKAGLKDQQGFVQPEALYYIQIEKSAFSVKGGLFDQLSTAKPDEQKCPFLENYQDKSKTVQLSAANGVALYDKNGNLLQKFDSDDWKLRAIDRLLSQENGRVILPNKLLEANTGACSGALFNVLYDGRISFAGTCDAVTCLKQELSALTKRPVGDDLTPFLGSVSTVVTDQGIASISGKEISFTRLVAEGGKVGSELSAPSIDDKNKLSQNQLLGSAMQVSSDGKVFLSGPAGSSVSGQEIGMLKTIVGSQGKIEFEASSKHLYLFIYVTAASTAQAIKDFGVVGTAKNADGSTTPKLSITEKTGMDSGLQQALEQIQGTGGLQSFETKDHIYSFTKDANGNPILRVIDKNTGKATDYRITQDPYRDANGNLVVPTDKGNFVFGFKQGPDGGPWVDAKGPDGLSELLPLLVARGQNGILTFNPTTGAINVYNGQDIPLSPEFAQKGIAFSGDAAGNVRGVPQDNFFAPPAAATSTQGGGVNPLALPSWPRELIALLAMLAVLAVCVVLVRFKFSENHN